MTVADNANNMVKAFDTAGNPLAQWGVAGRGPGYFTRPGGAAVGPDGSVYVADTLDQRIAKFAPDGTYVDQFGYVAPSSGFAAPATGPGGFNNPTAIAYEPASGNLWVTDTSNNRVEILNSAGGYLGELDGLSAPQGIAAGPGGIIYIADTGNNRVLQFTGSGPPTPISTSPLSSPTAVAPGAGGSLYVADANDVYRVPAGGGVATTVPAPPGGSFSSPSGLVFDGSRLYVADTGNNRVLRLSVSAGTWETVGTEDFQPGGFLGPQGLALSTAGTLFVADTANNRVQRLDPPGVSPPPRAAMTVARAGNGSGIVTSAPAGISCSTDCHQYFGIGHAVTLSATASAGSFFAGWQGACAGAANTPTCSLPISGTTSVVAVFNLAPVAPPPPPPPPPVSISRLHLSSRVLHQRPVRRRRSRILVDFTLSAPGSVVTQVQKATDGRRQGSRCVRTTRANRSRRRCTRFVLLRGTLTTRAPARRGRLTFTGTLARHRLKLGSYRFQFTPLGTDRRPGVLRFAAFSVKP